MNLAAPHKPFENSQLDLVVFVGRFQPLHLGHVAVLREGLVRGRRMVVLIGSAQAPRSRHNPFTAGERAHMLHAAMGHNPRLVTVPIVDSKNDLADWLARANAAVVSAWTGFRETDPTLPGTPATALIGHAKDATSYYLDLFPQWGSINVPQFYGLSATDIREHLFGQPNDTPKEAVARARRFLSAQRGADTASMPPATLAFLERFVGSLEHREVLSSPARAIIPDPADAG